MESRLMVFEGYLFLETSLEEEQTFINGSVPDVHSEVSEVAAVNGRDIVFHGVFQEEGCVVGIALYPFGILLGSGPVEDIQDLVLMVPSFGADDHLDIAVIEE